MLEPMGEFFDRRLDGYEEHQLTCIEAAPEFYRFTAEKLPKAPDCRVLDLGCGTGLELEPYYTINPTAQVTGVDLAPGMLNRLREKYCDRHPTLICGSYFDVPFGTEVFDAAVSVESLHHFTAEEKLPLFQKLRAALKPGGYFILTDYFALSEEEEARHRVELLQAKQEQRTEDGTLYHFDTPLTVEHEQRTLLAAGFTTVEILRTWGATTALKADK